MSHRESATPQDALLRVLINGEADRSDITRKIREWTQGRLDLDPSSLEVAVRALEEAGLIECHHGVPDARNAKPRATYALTPAGQASALAILAASLTQKA